ncbi:MAG: hypothetical protein V2A73_18530, partial [Pseudomonadota bacterium]
MAHRILGIDLGSYSVKVVVATAGFRGVTINSFLERQVSAGNSAAADPTNNNPVGDAASGAASNATNATNDPATEDRALRVLAELVREQGLEHELPFAGMPGDSVSMRVLEFQFSGLKLTDLEKAVGAELEAQLPYDLEDLVVDFEILPQDAEMKRAVV